MLAVVAENQIDLSSVLKLGPKLEDRLSKVHEMLAYAIRMGEGRVDRLLQVEAPRAALRLRSPTENQLGPMSTSPGIVMGTEGHVTALGHGMLQRL
ncbi:hypothetical protein CSUB01_12646 [Colletotrichum sublineola]|uniref:Uncharacterized protein n=1 Tax=Colletotrichum sublineola TaxID=1173701 RepID=A0A066XAC0_COLSU|nr:hypothetical protein CSUB01_12646 [Colletotrichum sublineola]